MFVLYSLLDHTQTRLHARPENAYRCGHFVHTHTSIRPCRDTKTTNCIPLMITRNLKLHYVEAHKKPPTALSWGSQETSNSIMLRLTRNLQLHYVETHKKPPTALSWGSQETSNCIMLRLRSHCLGAAKESCQGNPQLHYPEVPKKPPTASTWGSSKTSKAPPCGSKEISHYMIALIHRTQLCSCNSSCPRRHSLHFFHYAAFYVSCWGRWVKVIMKIDCDGDRNTRRFVRWEAEYIFHCTLDIASDFFQQMS